MINLRELFAAFKSRLLSLYPDNEAESLVFWLFEEFLSVQRMDIVVNRSLIDVPEILEESFQKLEAGVPIQYIIGKAPFYGYEFKVSPSVLIPRNETEELVHIIIKENKNKDLRILDIGTGSGCIPVTLFLQIAKSHLWACDISQSALVLAKENATSLKADVKFFKLNILSEEIPIKELDILVSNPPYIKESEKHQMHENVINHEPHLALFVPDIDPLVFYSQIATKGLKSLKSGGRIYFEINEKQSQEGKLLLELLGYTEVRILQDLNGKDRILSGIKP